MAAPLIKNFTASDANNQDFSSIWGVQVSTATGDEDYTLQIGQETILDITNGVSDNGNTDGPMPFTANGSSVPVSGNLQITVSGTTPSLRIFGVSK